MAVDLFAPLFSVTGVGGDVVSVLVLAPSRGAGWKRKGLLFLPTWTELIRLLILQICSGQRFR